MSKVISWGIGDFKSLTETKLELAPLTVLTGANSSGKSSILQSLLLLGQSYTGQTNLVLNGPLVRLGVPIDIVRDGQHSIELSIVVRLDASALDDHGAPEVVVNISLGPNQGNTMLVPKSFEVLDSSSNEVLIAATSSRRSISDDAHARELMGSDASSLRVTTIAGKKAPNRLYLIFRGLLPLCFLMHKDASFIKRTYLQSFPSLALANERVGYETLLELSQLVDKETFLRELGVPPDDRRPAAIRRRWTSKELSELGTTRLRLLIELAAEERAKSEWILLEPDVYRAFRRPVPEGILENALSSEWTLPIEVIGEVGDAIVRFAQELRYLGPLRDEPRVLHGAWDERVPALPVGIKGELTAEVLTRLQVKQVRFNDWDNQEWIESLPDAVARWCRYFGIGEQIRVLDQGKLGRGVEIRINGANRDLTTIGVGASQLLPVLVAALAISDGSTFLVEQPELHLHPEVQSKLADFFLFARPHVNFIVETHSEYLVTRIRRRVAESATEPSNVQVLFAEQRNGATSVRQLALSQLGDFSVWPHGFFDSQDEDSRLIAHAVRLAVTRGDN